MGWTLNIGQIKVDFKAGKYGALGVKFNFGKSGGQYEYYTPTETDKKLPVYNPDNPQKDFVDVRYTKQDGTGKKWRVNEVTKKYYDPEKATVFISVDKMSQMRPKTKEAKVISKQPMSKLNLTNISASEGYYLVPVRDYENIARYKKMIEFLGSDFVITSPIRLTVRSSEARNYAIFVDRRQNALVAMEVLVKAGKQPEPGGL